MHRAHDFAACLFRSAALLLGLASVSQAQFIRLEDIVAGGDGSGTAPADVIGIDPDTGNFVKTYFDGVTRETDGVIPSPVQGSEYIDSVFFLKGRVPSSEDGCGGCYVQYITQSGVQVWLPDGEDTGQGWNYILKNRVGGLSFPGIRVGGTNAFETSIGMHAAMGITFNLDKLRARYGAENVGCFSTFWGLDDCATGQVMLSAVLSNDSGAIDVRNEAFSAAIGNFLRIPLPPEARYLTLLSQPQGTDECDHAVFARPVIAASPCPAATSPWVWSVPEWRVPPGGGEIEIRGEFLNLTCVARVGGQICTILAIDPTYRLLTTPVLPVGFHDLEILDGALNPISRLPRAIEVVQPLGVTRFVPSHVLYDRQTRVTIIGENLRGDMNFVFEDIGEDNTDLSMTDISYQSGNQLTGSLPAWEYVRFSNVAGQTHTPAMYVDDQSRLKDYPGGFVTYHGTGIADPSPGIVSTEGGTQVTFDGVNIEAGMRLTLGGQPMTSVQVLGPTQIRGISPALPAGVHPAQLLTAGGQLIFPLENAVTAVDPGPPVIVSVVPSKVVSLGGTRVTITTSGAHQGAVPRVAGIPLVNVETIDGRTLRGEVPVLTPGRYDVDLVDASEAVISLRNDGLEVVADVQITITAVTPPVVSTLGGTPVTFVGSGFSSDFVPRLGGEPLTDVEVVSSTMLKGSSPKLAAGSKAASVETLKLELARKNSAVTAVVPDVPETMYVGHIRPARIKPNTSVLRFIGADLVPGLVPRVGGVPVHAPLYVSPCRVEGTAPNLGPGVYKADLFKPDFGVVAEIEELVEVANPGIPPRPDYIVSEPVRRDGSTRLFVFGNDFASNTVVTVGGKPLLDASVVSDELIVGRAPALSAGELVGLRDVVAADDRGSAALPSKLRYVEPEPEGNPLFVRGDSNGTGSIDLTDAVFILGYLFLGKPTRIDCLEAADADGNHGVSLTDAIYVLQYLFLGSRAPSSPFPDCGEAPPGGIGCAGFTSCGGSGGGVVGRQYRFYNNVKVIEENPQAPGDPRVIEMAPEEGEIVVRDPPGGVDLKIGDVIAGFTPKSSFAIHNGVAYMLKLVDITTGSCLSAGAGETVYKVRLAKLAEAMSEGTLKYVAQDFDGGQLKLIGEASCLHTSGGGASIDVGEQGSGGVGEGLFFDLDLGDFMVLNKQDANSYIHAGFHQCRIRYNSGINLGLGIGGSSVARLTFFAGLLLDSAVEFYVDASVAGQITEEKKIATLKKGTVIFLGPVPFLLTAGIDLYAGVGLQGGAHIYLDVGAQADFKAGFGFEVGGGGFKNLSGFEPPTIESLPNTPNFEVDGSAQARAYVRPAISISGGLLIKAVTAELQLGAEISGDAHVEGTINPPCFNWGLDAGLQLKLRTLIEIFGFDVLDASGLLVNEVWPDFLSGKVGCKKYPPVVSLKNSTESTPAGLLIHLDATGSYDPDGGPLKYTWEFTGGEHCPRETGSNPATTFLYNPAFTSACATELCAHGIRVRVTDDENTFTEKVTSFYTENTIGILVRKYPSPLLNE